MGLDMYAFRRKADATETTDEDGYTSIAQDELFYWRKHHDLHGWMQRLYAERTGIEDPTEFNCVDVELTLEDLARLERDVVLDLLPETTGFFFGNNPPDMESKANDMLFIAKARAAIAMGEKVFYSSWW